MGNVGTCDKHLFFFEREKLVLIFQEIYRSKLCFSTDSYFDIESFGVKRMFKIFLSDIIE